MKKSSYWPKSNAGRPTTNAELLGQVKTPSEIASQMVTLLFSNRGPEPKLILDPCVGPGTFLISLNKAKEKNPNDKIIAIDIDKNMVGETYNLKQQIKKDSYLINSDYLQLSLDSMFDYIILNPPYVRHEWIDNIDEYIDSFEERYNIKIPGTSNYYVYFIVKSIIDLKPGGRCVCIVYDSWQSTKYGKWLLNLIKKQCSYFEAIPIYESAFKGILINATIINMIKKRDFENGINIVESTPEIFKIFTKNNAFSTIDNLFFTQRGLQLKQSRFFKCDLSYVKNFGATPFVKKVGLIKGYYVPDDHNEAALLVTKDNINLKVVNELKRRIKIALTNPKKYESIINWYRQYPDKWYYHRKAPRASIIVNYYLRNKPRHIYNPTFAYSDNFYGLIPKNPTDEFALLAVLNSTYTAIAIMAKSRNQGDGLSKIQLFEYNKVLVPDWGRFAPSIMQELSNLGKKLMLYNTTNSDTVIMEIDKLLSSVLPKPIPRSESLPLLYGHISRMASQPREY